MNLSKSLASSALALGLLANTAAHGDNLGKSGLLVGLKYSF